MEKYYSKIIPNISHNKFVDLWSRNHDEIRASNTHQMLFCQMHFKYFDIVSILKCSMDSIRLHAFFDGEATTKTAVLLQKPPLRINTQ